jgi:hypothetical protein
MKIKSVSKKLILNKTTITKLNQEKMENIYGGGEPTGLTSWFGPTCYFGGCDTVDDCLPETFVP